MHTEGDGDMGSLAKGCMLRRIMSLAKVVDAVATENSDHIAETRIKSYK